MPRYDWEHGYSWPRGAIGPGPYDRGQIGMRSPNLARGPEGSWDWGFHQPREWAMEQRPRRGGGAYDRGTYGESYPTYGGYPGDDSAGMYYGRQPNRGGFRSRGPRRSYSEDAWADTSFARRRFLPESMSRGPSDLDRAFRGGRDALESDNYVLDDDVVLAAVRQSLANDNFIDSDQIRVEVSDGVVTLTGEVEDYLEARYAWDDAWDAAGVAGVIVRLDVRGTT